MKRRYLVDVEIACIPPPCVFSGNRYDLSEVEEGRVEDWIRNFIKFLRDHESQNAVYPDIRRTYEERCEYCSREWQEDERGCPICCVKAIKEWEEKNISKP